MCGVYVRGGWEGVPFQMFVLALKTYALAGGTL